MRTDYKFWYIDRGDDGYIRKCAIRFFEGDYKDMEVVNPVTEEASMVNIYVRSKRLQSADLAHLGSGFEKEESGDDCKIYTNADFGLIKTDDELRVFLNGEIQKDTERETIDIQKVTNLNTLKTMDNK